MKKIVISSALLLLPIFSAFAEATKTSTDDLNLGAMLQPVTDDNVFAQPGWYNWGASIVKEDGKYHVLFCQWPEKYGFYCWLTHARVSRAVADNPAGPYTPVETVLEGRGQKFWDMHSVFNPKVKCFDGKYYLYYTSTSHKGERFDNIARLLGSAVHISHLNDNQKKDYLNACQNMRYLYYDNQRVGVAVADKITGPWKRSDEPIVGPAGPIKGSSTSNPAVTQRPDGGYLMLVRGWGYSAKAEKRIRIQVVGLADDPAGPWDIQEKAAVGDLNAEDSGVWHDKKRKRYYGIYHAFGHLGLITSEDGKNWVKAKNYVVLKKTIKKEDGTMIIADRLERPEVYIEDGMPKVLSVAVRDKSGKAYSVFIPLKEPSK